MIRGPENWQSPDVISDGIDPQRFDRVHFDWVICGGESGPGERHPDWARGLLGSVSGSRRAVMKQMGRVAARPLDGGTREKLGIILNCSDEPQRLGKRAAGARLDQRTAFSIRHSELRGCGIGYRQHSVLADDPFGDNFESVDFPNNVHLSNEDKERLAHKNAERILKLSPGTTSRRNPSLSLFSF